MKYYLIAGEASGDLHSARLMKALKARDPQAEFRFWGGDKMREAGGEMVHHYKELAYMGFWEVFKNIFRLKKYIRQCKQDLLEYRPDALILTDYSGFNLRIAPTAKKAGIPVHFYIAPKIWAWNEGRIKKIKKYIDELYVILPFEKDYFEKKHGYKVHYVGNPLIERIEEHIPPDRKAFERENHLNAKPIIAILPGSRTQEIRRILPEVLPLTQDYPQYQFVIARAPGFNSAFYEEYVKDYPDVSFTNKTYDLLSLSEAAIVTSGTATLETALFKVPQVVVYRTSATSYRIAKMLIHNKLQFISLVNLIAGKKVVDELIQHECNTQLIKEKLNEILMGDKREQMFAGYYDLEKLLQREEKTSELVAGIILSSLRG